MTSNTVPMPGRPVRLTCMACNGFHSSPDEKSNCLEREIAKLRHELRQAYRRAGLPVP